MKKANDKSKSPYLKQIILSSCCAVLSLVVLAVATAAWFARNDRVKATNVNIKVDPEANLVISKNPVDPRDRQWLPEVTYEEESTAILTPISHDKDGDGTRLSTLHYCKLPSKIGRDTGYKIDNTTPDSDVFGAVSAATVGTRTFYKEITVLIASENKEFTNQTLTATMALAGVDTDLATNDPRYAAAVDVWVDSTDDDANWKGTLRYAEDGTQTTVTIPLDNNKIPITTSPIKVVLRCYFDGALEVGTTGKAYVRTAHMNLNDVNITVTFTATEKSGT